MRIIQPFAFVWLSLLVVHANLFPQIELQALKDLYTATNGSNWKWKPLTEGAHWNFSQLDPNPCYEKWQGVHCTSMCLTSSCNVQNLTLAVYNLVGTIPKRIADLTELFILDFDSNTLYGTIPNEMGSLLKLQRLSLSYNSLNGTLPTSMSNLHSLVVLDMTDNFISGTLPSNIGDLSTLELFSVMDNSMNGTLPQSFYNLTGLKQVLLDSNSFTGSISEQIHRLQYLRVFSIYKNYFIGSIPYNIGSLSNLLVLNVGNNRLDSSLPHSISKLTSLLELYVGGNFLTGTIPAFIGELHHLRLFATSSNFLNGTVPDSICNLANLTHIDLYSNSLVGTLPTAFGNLTNLIYFDVSSNVMTGTLPDNLFSKMKFLRHLFIEYNSFHGTLPQSMLTLHYIVDFRIHFNLFSGSLPNAVGALYSLQEFTLYDNRFTGTLPDSLGNCTKLKFLQLYDNYFNGTLPESLSNLRIVNALWVFNNLITGTIPASYAKLNRMGDFEVEYNFLHGTIPQTMGNFHFLLYFGVNNNFLSGPIPCSLGNATNLMVITTQYNFLTGSLPTQCFSRYNRLQVALLQNNLFHGDIDVVTNWYNLTTLNISTNQFAGGLSSLSWNLPLIQSVDFSNNEFVGNLNNVFTNMPYLLDLNLAHNQFTGTLTDVLISKALVLVDVSDNQFKGTIPSNIFSFRALRTFAAVKNCLTGTIPAESICLSTSLKTLALDGLHTAEECQDQFFPTIQEITSYQLKDAIGGTIASCLFTMPRLTTLHLSGNGLTGTLPDEQLFSSINETKLVDLSLSYNVLSGTIPLWMQQKVWKNIDLSFNQLNGVLKDSLVISSNVTLFKLIVNRLSGDIPSTILSADHVEILEGNIFQCSVSPGGTETRELPESDPDAYTYDCGSNSVNIAMYIWLTIAGSAFLAFILIVSFAPTTVLPPPADVDKTNETKGVGIFKFGNILRNKLVSWRNELMMWYNLYSDFESLAIHIKVKSHLDDEFTGNDEKTYKIEKRISSLYILGKSLELIRKLVWSMTIFIVFLLLPIYITLSIYYSTHSYSYIWIVSPAYVAGIPSAMIIFVVMIVFYILFGSKLNGFILWSTGVYKYNNDLKPQSSSPSESTIPGSYTTPLNALFEYSWLFNIFQFRKILLSDREDVVSSGRGWFSYQRWSLYSVYAGIVVLNITIVLAVNIVYVYVTTLDVDTTVMFFVELSISIFKILWGSIIVLGLFGSWLVTAARKYKLATANENTRLTEIANFLRFTEISLRATEFARMSVAERSTVFHKFLKTTEKARRAKFLISLVIFNNIAAPFLADVFVDPNCFQYLLQGQRPVTTSYNKIACNTYQFEINNNALSSTCYAEETATISTSYDPPFVYSYQCTSAILSGFVNIFIYRYLITGILVPLGSMLIEYLQDNFGISEYIEEIWMLLQYWQRFDEEDEAEEEENEKIITMETEETNNDEELDRPSKFSEVISTTDSYFRKPTVASMMQLVRGTLSEKPAPQENKSIVETADNTDVAASNNLPKTGNFMVDSAFKKRKKMKFFHKEAFVITLVGDIAVLLTFGLVFPPLGFIIAFAITTNTYLQQMKLGKLFLEIQKQIKETLPSTSSRRLSRRLSVMLNTAASMMTTNVVHIQLKALQRKLENDCGDLMELFWPAMPGLLFLSAGFIACFLFDILGDETGAIRALWIVIVTGCMPFCIWSFENIVHSLFFVSQSIATQPMKTIELRTTMTISPMFEEKEEQGQIIVEDSGIKVVGGDTTK